MDNNIYYMYLCYEKVVFLFKLSFLLVFNIIFYGFCGERLNWCSK